MKRALPFVVILAACAGGSEAVWLKPGTARLVAEQEYLACAADARRDFPERTRIATAPRITIGTGICEGNFCVATSSYPEIYDYDRNDPLRERAVTACMQAKGYREAVLPACPGGRGSALQSQPFDTTGLCVLNGQIVAPG